MCTALKLLGLVVLIVLLPVPLAVTLVCLEVFGSNLQDVLIIPLPALEQVGLALVGLIMPGIYFWALIKLGSSIAKDTQRLGRRKSKKRSIRPR